MNGLREVCHCGHAKDSHFEKQHTCLCPCDCKEYASDLEPKPVRKQEIRAAKPVDREELDTLPQFPARAPWPWP